MLDQSVRSAVLELHRQGHGTRTIAKALHISRGAVRRVLEAGSAEVPRPQRPEKGEPLETDIRDLYARCKGNLVRVHEELCAQGAALSYQALTAFCRRHGIGHGPKKPAGQYHFGPGEEMQHDTSPHVADIAGAMVKVQTASLVLCYSRMLFFQLFLRFTRFICKVFLTEALKFFGGAAARCMIDNTHVVVLRGTGAEMVPVPEMAAFAGRLGFTFAAHEKGDADRSAHVERQFHHIEHNFLAGRKFTDLAHANREALAWCERVNAKRRKHLHAAPWELFAMEQPHLKPLPLWVPEVYALHQRMVDLEGYVHLEGHHYSVPYQQGLIGRQVELRETKDQVLIFRGPREIARHQKVQTGQGRRVTLPEHRPPRGERREARRETSPEERELLAAEPPLPDYARAVKAKSSLRWPVALRRLAQMRQDYPRDAFLSAVRSAAHYGMYDLDRLERMVLRGIAAEYFVIPEGRDNDEEAEDEG
jgi:transposase